MVLTAAVAVSMAGCTPDFVTQSEADVILQILSVQGQSGHNDEIGATLFSDVSPVFNDNAILEMQAVSKNPNLGVPGSFNDIALTQYEVVYTRTDGRNVEGVDVPFRIAGSMGGTIPAGGTLTTNIVVVRHQAKHEPPLSNIAQGGGARNLTVQAHITVYGVTPAGRTVTASVILEITFADFAND